jgi:hypothetical protein
MITRYKDEHYPEIVEWLKARRMPVIEQSELSFHGFIEPGVACGFLINTDTKTTIIDFFISNPKAYKSERDQALDAIAQELIRFARVMGYKKVICRSQLDTIKDRAKRLGFTDLGEFRTFCMEL